MESSKIYIPTTRDIKLTATAGAIFPLIQMTEGQLKGFDALSRLPRHLEGYIDRSPLDVVLIFFPRLPQRPDLFHNSRITLAVVVYTPQPNTPLTHGLSNIHVIGWAGVPHCVYPKKGY